MSDGDINYDEYSDFELREALIAIDREKFPNNFLKLQAAIRLREQRDPAAAPVESDAQESVAAVVSTGSSGEPEIEQFIERLKELAPRTPVTISLIAVNVAVFVAMAIAGAGIMEPDGRVHVAWGSNLGPVTLDGEWWRLATSVFLHFGVIHLLLNMWVLYVNGQLAERMFGSARFLILYLVAGVAGSLASAAWNPAVNSAGASGAIFGVLGGLAVFLVAKRFHVPREVIRAQGKSVAAFVVYNVAFGVAHEGIDNAAHLGGLVSGFLIGMALARPTTASARAEARAPYIALVTVAAAVMLVAMAGLVVRSKGRMSPDDRYIAGALWFEHGESPVLAAYNGLVQQSHAGKLDDGAFADGLADVVIPFYMEAAERFRWESGSDSALNEERLRVDRYVGLRHAAMAKLERALREQDPDGTADAMKLLNQSDEAAKQINEAAVAKQPSAVP